MRGMRNPYKFLVGKPNGKRPFVKPRHFLSSLTAVRLSPLVLWLQVGPFYQTLRDERMAHL
jgi:hypothetical protein